jgi:hypothetical protein
MCNVEQSKGQHKNTFTLRYGVTYESGITVRLITIKQINEQDYIED